CQRGRAWGRSESRARPPTARARQLTARLGARREGVMINNEIEFGLDTPVFVTVDESGQPLSGDVVIRNTIEEAVLADAVGIDSFNIGEHYRADLMDSAGHVMLAAIASRTERIRLGTAVTVLSTQDPVRVYTD